jgi:hypothetical protein
MFTLHAYRAAAAVTATLTELSAIADQLALIQNNRIVPQVDKNLIFASGLSHTPLRLRLNSPSWRQYSAPHVRPLVDDNARTNGVRLANYLDDPLLCRALEEITIEGEQGSGAGADIYAGIALASGLPTPAPASRPFLIRGTSTTAATANAWSLLTMVWPDNLPNGMYAVVGLTAQSANARFARIIFEDQFERPGTPSIESLSEVSPQEHVGMSLGTFGRFSNNRMPNIEVLCAAADAAHVVFMNVARVG